MSADITARGRLGQDPKRIETKTGKPMTRASLAVGEGDETLWLGVVAFGKQAELLARHEKGDVLTVTGRLELNVWTTKEGEQRKDLQCIAEQMMSIRPKPKGYYRAEDAPAQHRPTAQQPWDDEVPFG